MSIINFIGQILLGAPFVVFAYWYQQEEALFQSAQLYRHTIYRHAAFGLFFSISFSILGLLFFPPITGATILIACIYIFIRSLDNIEEDRMPVSTTNKTGEPLRKCLPNLIGGLAIPPGEMEEE